VAGVEGGRSRLVRVVHHRANWRCSGHSVNPGRSITAKRARCSSSKRASFSASWLSSSSPGSLLFLRRTRARRQIPFRVAPRRPPERKRRSADARRREGSRLLNGDDYSTDRMGRARVTKYQNNVTNKYTGRAMLPRVSRDLTAGRPGLTNDSRINPRPRQNSRARAREKSIPFFLEIIPSRRKADSLRAVSPITTTIGSALARNRESPPPPSDRLERRLMTAAERSYHKGGPRARAICRSSEAKQRARRGPSRRAENDGPSA